MKAPWKLDLLVLGDFLFSPTGGDAGNAVAFALLDGGFEPRKSTIIRSQRDPKGWAEMLCGDKMTCDGMVKRELKDYIFGRSKKASRVGRPPLTPAAAEALTAAAGHRKSQ